MKTKKVLIVLATIVTVIVMNFLVLVNSVKAANIANISKVDLHYVGSCGELLKYKGTIVKTSYIEYTHNGKSYPAYCVNKELPGAEKGEYAVTPNGVINDVGLWKIIINGYPYKSATELRVKNRAEAFTATKHAVYCYLYENEPNDYEAIGEAGERTLNALNQIIRNAEASTETPDSGTVRVEAESEEWVQDEIEANYMSKIYCLNSDVTRLDYKVSIQGNYPEGTKIVDMKGNESLKFSGEDKFKIMLPTENLKEEGSFTIDVQTQVKTKPVIYGASPNAAWQNYALTAYMYEDAVCSYADVYEQVKEPKEPEVPEEPEIPEKPEIPSVPEPEEPTEELKVLPVTGM